MSTTTIASTATFLPPEEAAAIADEAVIHLRLLYAFRKLRMEIGSRDGLWGIWNARLEKQQLSPAEREQGLAKLKEKRWSVYLARAVHRYSAWWTDMESRPLTEQDTNLVHTPRYATFTTASVPKKWTPGNMLPLGMPPYYHGTDKG